MANLNKIILIGRLIDDPETKVTVEGVPMAKFRLAVDRFKKEGSPQATDIIDVIAWRKLAESCGELLKKGRLALVEGRIQVRSYEDQVGSRKWVTEVVAKNMQLIERGGKSESAPGGAKPEEASILDELGEDIPEDDLPF